MSAELFIAAHGGVAGWAGPGMGRLAACLFKFLRPGSRAPATARSGAPATVVALLMWLALLLPALTGAQGIMISEFMAVNQTGIRDEDGERSDSIELYNPSTNTVDLTGWSLTDEVALSAKWVFPATSLVANKRLLVFASGKHRSRPGVSSIPISSFTLRVKKTNSYQ
ncbi:MAG: lamin tail domain-containing protein [Pedosphaera sp.]|nr:lamin tail domain-containing protein [Pedosphaera sp.]